VNLLREEPGDNREQKEGGGGHEHLSIDNREKKKARVIRNFLSVIGNVKKGTSEKKKGGGAVKKKDNGMASRN